MHRYSLQLGNDLGIETVATDHLATTIAQECAALSPKVLAEVQRQDVIGIGARLDELLGFQAFMDLASSIPPNPAVTRAQVITQNYICFVYLGDSCFKVLQRHTPLGSTIRKCCRFLTDNPIRAFRNSLAHANWSYNSDCTGLLYWARKGSEPNEPLSEFAVSQLELGFWQALARCVAYVTFTHAVDATQR